MSRILSGDERLSTEAHVGVGDAQLWPALTASASGHGGVRGWGGGGRRGPRPARAPGRLHLSVASSNSVVPTGPPAGCKLGFSFRRPPSILLSSAGLV